MNKTTSQNPSIELHVEDPQMRNDSVVQQATGGPVHFKLGLFDQPASGTSTPTTATREQLPNVLILTPVKNALAYLPRYVHNLLNLSYPRERISIAFLESDSDDGSYQWIATQMPVLERVFRRFEIYKRDFGYRLDDVRWAKAVQRRRRAILAKSRNALLLAALKDEQYVLWLDVDVADYPSDVIEKLLATGKRIVVPNCVVASGGPNFDLNTFKFKDPQRGDAIATLYDGLYQPDVGEGRWYLHDLDGETLLEVDAVGGTMLLVDAELHRDGLNFPSFPYRHYIETEALAMMARDMGETCWAVRSLEVIHPPAQ